MQQQELLAVENLLDRMYSGAKLATENEFKLLQECRDIIKHGEMMKLHQEQITSSAKAHEASLSKMFKNATQTRETHERELYVKQVAENIVDLDLKHVDRLVEREARFNQEQNIEARKHVEQMIAKLNRVMPSYLSNSNLQS